jgi:NADH-quinone oxidoreductase subunit N
MKALIIVFLGAVLVLFAGLGKQERRITPLVWLILLLALVSIGLEYKGWKFPWEAGMDNMLAFSKGALVFSGVLVALTLVGTMIYQPREADKGGDVYAMMLFSVCGALILTSFTSFFTLFLGIEIMSIPLYVLAGFRKENLESNEAALKYYLMGAFATGIFLFGTALIYGATGSFSLEDISLRYILSATFAGLSPMAKVGIMVVMVGMLFKVAAAPFHFWAPDVYQGSPTRVTAFMATVIKAAGIVAFFRLFTICFSAVDDFWGLPLSIVAGLTVLIGNLSAIMQSSFKRMLAWSSVAHAGYLLLAVLNHKKAGGEALVIYTAGYGFASLIAFGIYRYMRMQTAREDFQMFNGFSAKNPFLAFCMTVSMLSMAGIPATAGFAGKYLLFSSVFNDYAWLVILALVMSAVSIYYYFRVIIAMYFQPAEENSPTLSLPLQVTAGLGISLLLIFLLGIFPAYFFGLL